MSDGACKACGKTVNWVKDIAGKPVPLDPVAVIYVQASEDPDGPWKTTKRAQVTHFATCSGANALTKQKEGVTAVTIKFEGEKTPVITINGKSATVKDLHDLFEAEDMIHL